MALSLMLIGVELYLKLLKEKSIRFFNISYEIHVDKKNRVVTTPAFMCETKVHEIHDGIGKMVTAVMGMI